MKSTLRKLFYILTFSAFTSAAIGQVTVKYQIDCDSILPVDDDVHIPIQEKSFMAAIDLDFPRNWKNQDTIRLTPFTIDNLQHGMTMISMAFPSERNKTEQVTFSTLVYFEHGEYGSDLENSYYAYGQLENEVLILREVAYWFSFKPRGKKHKYKVVNTGRNCLTLVKLNPTSRKLYPKEIPARKAKKIITVKNY